MSIYENLMNDIRQRNMPKAQLIDQMNSQADTLQNMPQQNPDAAYKSSLGMGMLAAPPEMGTLQALGQAFPGAMDAMRQTQEQNIKQQRDSMAMRQAAADTLQAVEAYNFEKGVKQHHMKHLDATLGETSRHNQMTEQTDLMNAQAHLMAAGNKGNLLGDVQKEELKGIMKNGANFHQNFDTALRVAKEARKSGYILPLVEDASNIEQINSQLDSHHKVKLGKSGAKNIQNAKEAASVLIKDKLLLDTVQKGLERGMPIEQAKKVFYDQWKNPTIQEDIKKYIHYSVLGDEKELKKLEIYHMLNPNKKEN